jgi:hypothetical protein
MSLKCQRAGGSTKQQRTDSWLPSAARQPAPANFVSPRNQAPYSLGGAHHGPAHVKKPSVQLPCICHPACCCLPQTPSSATICTHAGVQLLAPIWDFYRAGAEHELLSLHPGLAVLIDAESAGPLGFGMRRWGRLLFPMESWTDMGPAQVEFWCCNGADYRPQGDLHSAKADAACYARPRGFKQAMFEAGSSACLVYRCGIHMHCLCMCISRRCYCDSSAARAARPADDRVVDGT